MTIDHINYIKISENNGHEHDGLGYHYHLTIEANNDDTPKFPFTHGPNYKGDLPDNSFTHCGGPPPPS